MLNHSLYAGPSRDMRELSAYLLEIQNMLTYFPKKVELSKCWDKGPVVILHLVHEKEWTITDVDDIAGTLDTDKINSINPYGWGKTLEVCCYHEK